MINGNGLLPLPVVATYNPLARQPDEEEQARLKAQPLPPVEQAEAGERSAERRRSDLDAEQQRAEQVGSGRPGGIIDSYA